MNVKRKTRGLVARDLMQTGILTVAPDARVYDAVQLLLQRRLSGAPVVDRADRVVGYLSEHGCVQALLRAVVHRLPSSHVRDVMDTDVVSVIPEAHILSVAQLFVSHRARRVLVVRDNRLVGLITRHDLLEKAAAIFREAPDRKAAILMLGAFDGRTSLPPL